MNYQERLAISNAWWISRVFGINRVLLLVLILATIAAFASPYILSLFVPCANYMEIEALMVLFLGLSTVGFLNIAFAFSPFIESILPISISKYSRFITILLLPALLSVCIFWVTFGPFIPHLFGNTDVLCD